MYGSDKNNKEFIRRRYNLFTFFLTEVHISTHYSTCVSCVHASVSMVHFAMICFTSFKTAYHLYVTKIMQKYSDIIYMYLQ